jgi:hypothetical protein
MRFMPFDHGEIRVATNRRLPRLVRCARAVSIVTISTGFAVAPSVHTVRASSSGCAEAGYSNTVCVGVHGASVRVAEVDGGLILGARHSMTGYWTIKSSDGQINITTPTRTYSNQSYVHTQSYNSGWYTINRDLANGATVCSSFYQSTGPIGTACVSIKA